MNDVLQQFVAKILDVADGERTNNELADIHEIAIFKSGVTL